MPPRANDELVSKLQVNGAKQGPFFQERDNFFAGELAPLQANTPLGMPDHLAFDLGREV